jgi:hypothetical protein
MSLVAQLERIALVRAKDTAAIYLLDRGMGIWLWLCPECVAKRADDGWAVKERREPPHELDCEDCKRRPAPGRGAR